MKKVVTFLFILLFATSVFAQKSIWFDGTFDEAKEKAQKEGKLILVDYFLNG